MSVSREECRENLIALGIPRSSLDLLDSFILLISREDAETNGDESPKNLDLRLHGICTAVTGTHRGQEDHEKAMHYAREYFWASFGEPTSTYEDAVARLIAENEGEEGASKTREDPLPGWVYVISNPSMPGIVKIGMTSVNVPRRLAQLSSGTSVAMPFELEWSGWFDDCVKAESLAHDQFRERRINGREFFKISPEEAAKFLSQIQQEGQQ